MPYCVIFEFLFETLQENLQALYHSNKLNLHSQGFDKRAQECLKKMSFDVANGLEYLTRNGVSIWDLSLLVQVECSHLSNHLEELLVGMEGGKGLAENSSEAQPVA